MSDLSSDTPEEGIPDGCDSPRGCLGPLEEQPVLLTAQLSLQTLNK